MIIKIGNFTQTADPRLSGFVLGCIVIVAVLLIGQAKATEKALDLSYSALEYDGN